jgi:hypothetical protein
MPKKTPVKKKSAKRKAAPKTDAHAEPPKRGRGRPPVEFRKRSFHLLLDPRYIEHWRKKCDEMNVPPQDLARMAMNAVIPDPYNPGNVGEIETFLGRLHPK